MSFGGNSRGLFTLEIFENYLQANLWLSDGNSPLVHCSVFARTDSLSREDGLELMSALWYHYGMGKFASTVYEWNFFQAYWELEVFRRFQIAVKHPRELTRFVRLEGGVLDTHSGNVSCFDANGPIFHVGTELAHLMPTHQVRNWVRMNSFPSGESR